MILWNLRGQAFLVVVIGENILTQRRKGANVKNSMEGGNGKDRGSGFPYCGYCENVE